MNLEGSAAAWKEQRERGAPFMLRLILWIARHAGRSATRVLLAPITAYFLLTARQARRASRRFLRKALGRPPSWLDLARHFHCFAAVTLDRLFFLMGRSDLMTIKVHRAAEEEQGTYRGERGSLLFVAHLGSFEGLRTIGHRRMPMKVLLDRGQGRMLTSLIETLNPELAKNIIDVSRAGPELALSVKQALDQNSRVGIMVDRARPGERIVQVEFFGAPAVFPAGPWLLAATLKARVVLAFSLYRGGNRYDTYHELFAEELVIPRASRAEELQRVVQRYARRLEHHVRLAPYNWFNYYDFWNEAS